MDINDKSGTNLLNEYEAIVLALSTGKRIEIQKNTNADESVKTVARLKNLSTMPH